MSVPDLAYSTEAQLPPDESELAARICMGDESAYEMLYRTYHQALWRFAYAHVRSSDVAEEIVQDVFFALWRDRTHWSVRASARAWLYAAVRHHALNHLRHERVVMRMLDPSQRGFESPGSATSDDAGAGATVDAQLEAEAQELTDAITRAVSALSERRRAAITLRWKRDLSAAEIARVLNTTPESVRVLLARARQDLAALLGPAALER